MTGTASGATLRILSPSDGAQVDEGEPVWLEVKAEDAGLTAVEPADVVWTVHGTDWQVPGNRVWVSDLPRGWALVVATATVDGAEVSDGVEIVVGGSGTGDDTGPTDTNTGGPGPIDHVMSLVFEPSPDFENKGYATCSASFSAQLRPRTSGDLCPDTDLTFEGSLAQDSSDCPPELLGSIPDPIAYGIDVAHPDGWGLYVPDRGSWFSIGVAEDTGGAYRLIVEQTAEEKGVTVGDVTWRFDFTP